MERYTRIYSLPTNLYAEGSLVILEAGALLKDNANNTMLAQLKFKNINPKAIKMLKVEIISKDSMGRDLEPATAYQYLDLHVCRNDSFGSQQAIALHDNSVRSFDVKVLEIGLEDNSIVKGAEAKWKALPNPTRLDNSELSKQCKIAFGDDYGYEMAEYSDLWYCACGALNRKDEENCHKCNRPFIPLSDPDIQELTVAMEQRLADEKHQRELAEQKCKEEEAEAERIRKIREAEAAVRKKKTSKIIALVGAAVAAVVAVFLLVTKVVIPNQQYNAAVLLMDTGRFEEAISTFQKISDYKDSDNLIQDCLLMISEETYTQAITLTEQEEYSEAIRLFESICPYKDSESRLQLAIQNRDAVSVYENAVKAYDTEDYVRAYELFGTIDFYKDAAKHLTESKYQYAIHLLTYGLSANYEDNQKAYELLSTIKEYRDVSEYLSHIFYRPIGQFEDNGRTYIKHAYDEYGREIHNGEEYSDSGILVCDNEYDYTCDKSGHILSAIPKKEYGLRIENKYNAAGLLVEKRSYGTNTLFITSYEYNDKNECHTSHQTTRSNGKSEMGVVSKYQYDINGNLTAYECYQEWTPGTLSLATKTTYQYDDNGNLISSNWENSNGKTSNTTYLYAYVWAPLASS